ncbi:CD2-associated protein isoform X2 [Amia ocellicauda]|uniref:CD2-associated protein isoform X2 n=1 Tax=Amia ocellicauda TaxID=2972642 RepID=UPI00346402AB
MGSKKRQCKALFEYVPQNEDELELKVGDIIDINEEVEEGWWSGTMNGKSGLFPSNFVKEIEVTEDHETNEVSDEPEIMIKDSLLVAPSTPTSPLASPGTGNGIAQPKKVRGVGFGDIFREGSVKLKVRLPSSESEEKKTEKPLPSLPSAKPAHLNMTDSVKVDGESKAKVKEYCKVLYPFDATNEDELSLKEGETVHVLSKDTGEPGWWRGEVNGREGVFPDNFVAAITETEKDATIPKVSTKVSPKMEAEDKPKKPPPPVKSTAPKPEVPNNEKKPLQGKLEEKGDKPVPDHKPVKPAAPVVPPKKPVPPPGKAGILARTGTAPPKRPDKPLLPPPGAKPNGEVPSTRPKSDFEPIPLSKPKTLSGDWGEKAAEMDLISFDELSSTSGKLSHPTTSRPKMPGRRLPTQFAVGSSPSKELNVGKTTKVEEEEAARPNCLELKKPPLPTHVTPSPTHVTPSPSKPIPAVVSVSASDQKPKAEAEEDNQSELEHLRTQINELLHTVELIKTQQRREITDLRIDLDEEKSKRIALQMEIEKLKKAVQLT